jgi:Membrane proteins related to metalloendopeptidases
MAIVLFRPSGNPIPPLGHFGPRPPLTFHNGLDFRFTNQQGVASLNIVAANAGTVESVVRTSTMGNYTVINHGSYKTAYAHQAKVLVKAGDRVAKGQLIGIIGETGTLAIGKHLHFELWVNGTRIDPEPYLTTTAGEGGVVITPEKEIGRMSQIQFYMRSTNGDEWMIGGREIEGGYKVTLDINVARRWGRQYSGIDPQGTAPVRLNRDDYIAQQVFLKAENAEWKAQQVAIIRQALGAAAPSTSATKADVDAAAAHVIAAVPTAAQNGAASRDAIVKPAT